MKSKLLNFLLVLFLIFSFTFISAGELRVTEEHPFLINGEWIEASQLKVGDELTLTNGSKVTIKKLTSLHSNESFKVYNLEAGDYHNFVVGEEGVVVHNSDFDEMGVFSNIKTRLKDLMGKKKPLIKEGTIMDPSIVTEGVISSNFKEVPISQLGYNPLPDRFVYYGERGWNSREVLVFDKNKDSILKEFMRISNSNLQGLTDRRKLDKISISGFGENAPDSIVDFSYSEGGELEGVDYDSEFGSLDTSLGYDPLDRVVYEDIQSGKSSSSNIVGNVIRNLFTGFALLDTSNTVRVYYASAGDMDSAITESEYNSLINSKSFFSELEEDYNDSQKSDWIYYSCKDSDSGENESFVYGFVDFGVSGSVYDSCLDNRTLSEYYCDEALFQDWNFWIIRSVPKTYTQVCEFGCSEGRCLQTPVNSRLNESELYCGECMGGCRGKLSILSEAGVDVSKVEVVDVLLIDCYGSHGYEWGSKISECPQNLSVSYDVCVTNGNDGTGNSVLLGAKYISKTSTIDLPVEPPSLDAGGL